MDCLNEGLAFNSTRQRVSVRLTSYRHLGCFILIIVLLFFPYMVETSIHRKDKIANNPLHGLNEEEIIV